MVIGDRKREIDSILNHKIKGLNWWARREPHWGTHTGQSFSVSNRDMEVRDIPSDISVANWE